MICHRSIAKRGICMRCIIILMLIIIWMFPKGWEMYQLHPRENHLQGHAKILPNSWTNKYVGYLNDLGCTHYYTRYCNIHHRTWMYLHDMYYLHVGVHEMCSQMHPSWGLTTILIVGPWPPFIILAYPMVAYTPLVTGNFPTKTLVAKQRLTNNYVHTDGSLPL